MGALVQIALISINNPYAAALSFVALLGRRCRHHLDGNNGGHSSVDGNPLAGRLAPVRNRRWRNRAARLAQETEGEKSPEQTKHQKEHRGAAASGLSICAVANVGLWHVATRRMTLKTDAIGAKADVQPSSPIGPMRHRPAGSSPPPSSFYVLLS